MDSYFFSEVIKYLYLLMNSGLRNLNSSISHSHSYGYLKFDPSDVIFTTQGHFILLDLLRNQSSNWKCIFNYSYSIKFNEIIISKL